MALRGLGSEGWDRSMRDDGGVRGRKERKREKRRGEERRGEGGGYGYSMI